MDLELLELLGIALAPVVFLFTYIYLKDEYEREPLKYLLITFFLGVLSAIPVIFLGNYVESYTGIGLVEDNWVQTLLYAFVVVAFTEELIKYLVLRWYIYPHKEFDEPYDGIMYGAAVSLGFAAIENVIYVLTSEDGIGTGLLRMFTAVPAHAMFGVLMGYFVGKAKFANKGSLAIFERLKGLLVAILFHGLYDFFLFLNEQYLTIFAFFSLVTGVLLATRAIRFHVDISPHKETFGDSSHEA
ncbi:MAG: PrsW family glutamic-type intramembrane protease [Bacteroidia bacterium]|jgi:protease PrsW|nr:PrsW family glutamic-type intramembrane protease [Bacteroidia bacterium]